MSVSDNRDPSGSSGMDTKLLQQGIKQLQLEIATLTGWLNALGPSDAEPRLAYEDMLRSRREMLTTLQRQAQAMNKTAHPDDIPPSDLPSSKETH